MRFSVTSSLDYHVFENATIVCSVSCSSDPGQEVLSERLTLSREAERADLVVGLTANRFTKVNISEPGDFSIRYEATVQSSLTRLPIASILPGNPCSFDAVALPFLNPSRYAPADQLRTAAHDLFGSIEGELDQALAIEQWLYDNIRYEIGASTEQSWSLDTFETRSGVCRDFAHLGITFCRALNIPARYVTVYAYQLNPQDFHAVFEVYINGTWLVMDGTRLAPLNGMIRIATGRDASETAVATLYGNIQGQQVQVSTHLANSEEAEFSPLTRDDLRQAGDVAYL
jgi:transglutaminase-like putative cysteine protease